MFPKGWTYTQKKQQTKNALNPFHNAFYSNTAVPWAYRHETKTNIIAKHITVHIFDTMSTFIDKCTPLGRRNLLTKFEVEQN